MNNYITIYTSYSAPYNYYTIPRKCGYMGCIKDIEYICLLNSLEIGTSFYGWGCKEHFEEMLEINPDIHEKYFSNRKLNNEENSFYIKGWDFT